MHLWISNCIEELGAVLLGSMSSRSNLLNTIKEVAFPLSLKIDISLEILCRLMCSTSSTSLKDLRCYMVGRQNWQQIMENCSTEELANLVGCQNMLLFNWFHCRELRIWRISKHFVNLPEESPFINSILDQFPCFNNWRAIGYCTIVVIRVNPTIPQNYPLKSLIKCRSTFKVLLSHWAL